MKITTPLLFTSLCLLGLSDAHAAASGNATLRISCEDESDSPQVYINNQFKGECSLDVQVRPGNVQIRVVDARKRVFEKTLRVAAGTSKRIDVDLGVEERAAAEQAAQAAYKAAWKKLSARWWQMPADRDYSCSDLKARVTSRIRNVQDFSCNCEISQVQHPAWKRYDQTECKARFQANLVENNTQSFYYDDTQFNKYSFKIESDD